MAWVRSSGWSWASCSSALDVAPDSFARPAQIKFVLIQGGTINGRVTDQTGKTLTDALVGVVRRIYRNGNVALDVVDGKPTDDRGTFRLYRLPPGEYYVAALTQRGPVPTAQ